MNSSLPTPPDDVYPQSVGIAGDLVIRLLAAAIDALELKMVLFVALKLAATPAQAIRWEELMSDPHISSLVPHVSGQALYQSIEAAALRAEYHGFLVIKRSFADFKSALLTLGMAPIVKSPEAEEQEVSIQADEEWGRLVRTYEQNIGLLTPLIVDALHSASERYPSAWVEEAIVLATQANRRSWRYIQRILERWEAEGRDLGATRRGNWTPESFNHFTKGTYGRHIRS
jgi:DnaD/phage-associated family protein